MNNLFENYILCGFGLLLGLVLGNWLIPYLDQKVFMKKHLYGKHCCNHCERNFCCDDEQVEYQFCPYCGKPLDYHEATEMYSRMHSDDDAVERPNRLLDAQSEGDSNETP